MLADRRHDGEDASRIQREQDPIVSVHYCFKVAGFCNLGYLIYVSHVRVQVRVLNQLLLGALEEDIVDGVEADERGEEADVG